MVLGSIKPREQVGRDTFSRYRAQVRSAAISALEILEGKVDRVYCDVHDDFVVRYKLDSGYKYSFYQVKTHDKSNFRWTLNDLFGITTTGVKAVDVKKIKDSFGGKMILHTANFPDCCVEVVFQTNITVNDTAEKFIQDIESGSFSGKYPKILFDKFHEVVGDSEGVLSPEGIKECLSKFKIQQDVQYIKNKNHRFESYAIDSIYKYSEIELSRIEQEIILLKLVDVVSEKSSGIIDDYSEETIESEAAISIDDLLNVLSISRSAYDHLKESGDEKAIKNVSTIQRSLKGSGADSEQLMYCTECKVKWDIWWRDNRHLLPGHKLFAITERVNDVLRSVVKVNTVDFSVMIERLEALNSDLILNGLLFDLGMDELIGAFFSELSKELS